MCREVGLTGQLGQSNRLGGKSRIRGHGDLISWRIRRFHSISDRWQGQPRRAIRNVPWCRPHGQSRRPQPDRYPAGPPSGGVSTAKASTTELSGLAFLRSDHMICTVNAILRVELRQHRPGYFWTSRLGQLSAVLLPSRILSFISMTLPGSAVWPSCWDHILYHFR